MVEHKGEIQKRESKAIANNKPNENIGSISTLGFLDNRPEMIVQRKLQNAANIHTFKREPLILSSSLQAKQENFDNHINKKPKEPFQLKENITSKHYSREKRRPSPFRLMQMKPTPNKDGTYYDPDYPGLVLTLNKAKTEEWGENVYDATGVSNPTSVTHDSSGYSDINDDGATWHPQLLASSTSSQAKDSYSSKGNYDAILDIANIDYLTTGNVQEAKKESLRQSIKTGTIPPISIKDEGDGNYTLIDGRNRIEVSLEAGYTKIPVKFT